MGSIEKRDPGKGGVLDPCLGIEVPPRVAILTMFRTKIL